MCGGFGAAIGAGALTAWAQCWFLVLIFVVFVTIMVLFIVALLHIMMIHRKI